MQNLALFTIDPSQRDENENVQHTLRCLKVFLHAKMCVWVRATAFVSSEFQVRRSTEDPAAEAKR